MTLSIYAQPGHLIRRAQQVSSALFAEECGAFDITAVQYAAMVAIDANPGVDATRLSALVAFDRSTLGNVLERLEGKRWVVRDGSVADRRVKRLQLTPAGVEVLRAVKPAVERVQTRMLAPLAGPDQAELVRLLAQLVDVHNDIVPAPLMPAPLLKELA